jgi:3-phosphoshikimate 1-carboxyvinyltransferase
MYRCLYTMTGMSTTATNPQASLWDAPAAHGRISATVDVPGSKSLSNRYLVLSALGDGPVTLVGLLRSRDTDLMMNGLRKLGVVCRPDPDDPTTVRVIPTRDRVFHGNVTVDCGLAGTVMRFLPGLALFADGPVSFDGDEQAYARPMKPVLDGLEQMGASVTYRGRPGFLPFVVTPPCEGVGAGGTEPVRVEIDSSGSSQFVSGLLLIGSRLRGGLTLTHTGDALPSMPHIRMTMEDINAAGGDVVMPSPGVWQVRPAALDLPGRVVVEPDLSNAAPFLGAALIAGGEVRVDRWPRRTTQPGGRLPRILERMGASIRYECTPRTGNAPVDPDPGSTTLVVRSNGAIHALGRFDMSAEGEMAPSIAALATLADGPTSLVGIGHLRGHETNRLAAMVTEIRRVGAWARELDDGIEIVPPDRHDLHAAVMHTYADHRMATFAAMLGLAIPGIVVMDIAATRKTIPDFPGMWATMLS